MKTAADLMTTDVIFLSTSMTLEEALHLFVFNRLHTMPVKNAFDQVEGFLSDWGLVIAYLTYQRAHERDKVGHYVNLLEKMESVSQDAPIPEVVRAIGVAPQNRVIVQNEVKKIVGIVTPKDVLKHFKVGSDHIVDMKEELKNTKAKLKEMSVEVEAAKTEAELFKNVYESSPYMIHSADRYGKIILANKRLHSTLGYEPGELVGRSIFDLYSSSSHKAARQGLEKIENDGYHQTTYTSMLKKTGEPIRVDVASTSLRDDKGSFRSTITMSRIIDADALLRSLHGMLDEKESRFSPMGVDDRKSES